MTTPISAGARADATRLLRAAGCVFAEEEQEALAAAATDDASLAAMVTRRAGGEPLEQVVGYADFCGLRIELRPGVFVPRRRSELLVRLAVEATRAAKARASTAQATTAQATAAGQAAAPNAPTPIVVDLCCGSGALGAAVLHAVPEARLHATDLEPTAVACARGNLAGSEAQVHQGDLFEALPPALAGRIDVLIANVPYVPSGHIPLLPAEARLHEPRMALDGGGDGLDVLRAVVAQAPRWLAPGGVLLSETTEAQVAAATTAIRAAGLRPQVTADDDYEATVVHGHH